MADIEGQVVESTAGRPACLAGQTVELQWTNLTVVSAK